MPIAPSLGGSRQSFQFGYALFQRSNRNFHFGGGVSRRDVLRTVPIEGNDFDEKQPFHNALDFRFGELSDEFGVLSRIFDAGMAEDFQPRALRIVHQEQRHPVGHCEVAGGKQLAVAFVIGESERSRIDDPQKPRLATAMLNVSLLFSSASQPVPNASTIRR